MNCKATTNNGKPCMAPAQHGKAYCFQHDPTLTEERDAARKRGGAARRVQLRGSKVPNLEKAADVQQYLCRVLHDTERLLIPPNTARAIAHLCKVQLDTIHEVELRAESERIQTPKYG